MRAVRRYTTREIVCARLALSLATLRPPVPTPPPARRLFLPTHLGAYFVAMSATLTGGWWREAQFGGGVRYAIAAAARGVPLPFPPLPFRDSLRPPPRTPAPLPADLGELDLLAPVLCAFPLELELELELGCAESRRSNPASADGRLGRLPGIFGRLGTNFYMDFAPGAALTLAARCSPRRRSSAKWSSLRWRHRSRASSARC
ncbi:hypothetical protein B0H14DRAFT_2634143 [Mycena olivaceomarginata]|nr:hypothetical protein B0H14DRAFT_2634143 [Mycena olivaceomarginata]